jgi:hypothetical protein
MRQLHKNVDVWLWSSARHHLEGIKSQTLQQRKEHTGLIEYGAMEIYHCEFKGHDNSDMSGI